MDWWIDELIGVSGWWCLFHFACNIAFLETLASFNSFRSLACTVWHWHKSLRMDITLTAICMIRSRLLHLLEQKSNGNNYLHNHLVHCIYQLSHWHPLLSRSPPTRYVSKLLLLSSVSLLMYLTLWTFNSAGATRAFYRKWRHN